MSYFLVIFDRHRRKIDTEVERIEDPDRAVRRLFELEEQLQTPGDRGVVLLVADDEEDLRRTHAQYFKSFDELLELA